MVNDVMMGDAAEGADSTISYSLIIKTKHHTKLNSGSTDCERDE